MKYTLVAFLVFFSSHLIAQHQTKPLRYVFQKTTPSEIPYGNNTKAGHYVNSAYGSLTINYYDLC